MNHYNTIENIGQQWIECISVIISLTLGPRVFGCHLIVEIISTCDGLIG
jgi:hypothetical protein